MTDETIKATLARWSDGDLVMVYARSKHHEGKEYIYCTLMPQPATPAEQPKDSDK